MNKSNIHGVLLLDKPLGWSSNQAVQKVKRLFQASKVGHTGTLDPLATGLLPLCMGEATKFGQALLNADKAYEAVVQLGQTTTTGDSEGDIVETRSVPSLDEARLSALAESFLGDYLQTPPMYSALKHQGQALYQLARRGVVIEREPRLIKIHDLRLIQRDATCLELSVRCSKGTYIRTLAEDIGSALGCGAHLTALRRTAVASLPIQSMVSWDQLLAATDLLQYLLPIDSCVKEVPPLILSTEDTKKLLWGQAVWLTEHQSFGVHRLYTENQQFLGLADHRVDGRLWPQRLVNSNWVNLA